MRTTMLLLSLTLASGCAMTGPVDCSAWRELRFSDPTINAMTREEARAVLAHNLTGRRLCGW